MDAQPPPITAFGKEIALRFPIHLDLQWIGIAERSVPELGARLRVCRAPLEVLEGAVEIMVLAEGDDAALASETVPRPLTLQFLHLTGGGDPVEVLTDAIPAAAVPGRDYKRACNSQRVRRT